RLGFFFQAEDGIRDGHVTGVQTCALPISLLLPRRGKQRPEVPVCFEDPPQVLEAALAIPERVALEVEEEVARRGIGQQRETGARSEERRVGKECRSRWLPGQ